MFKMWCPLPLKPEPKATYAPPHLHSLPRVHHQQCTLAGGQRAADLQVVKAVRVESKVTYIIYHQVQAHVRNMAGPIRPYRQNESQTPLLLN